MVTPERPVPGDHSLLRIDAANYIGFIGKVTEDHYCDDSGRPPLPLHQLVKALFAACLFRLRSGRQLMCETVMKLA